LQATCAFMSSLTHLLDIQVTQWYMRKVCA